MVPKYSKTIYDWADLVKIFNDRVWRRKLYPLLNFHTHGPLCLAIAAVCAIIGAKFVGP